MVASFRIVSFYLFLDSRGPCSRRYCNTNSYCVESGDLAYCECPTCNLHYTPVCGSDGVTYSNECFLRKASCDKEEDISVVSQGSCSKLFQIYHSLNQFKSFNSQSRFYTFHE